VMEEQEELTPKQLKFITEYVKDFNGTQAAIRAGYAASGARTEAWRLLTNADIKSKIEELLKSASLGPDETKKLITDIATSNVSNFFKKVKVQKSKLIRKDLHLLIDELRAEFDFEDEYARQAALAKKELESHEKSQQYRRRQIIRYKLELKNNPKAFRIVDGPTELVDDVELDLVALTGDKEGGRIKSIKNGKYGLEVDLLPADSMINAMARIHGMFIDKSEIDLNATIDTVVKIGYGEGNQGA
jgi:phage terminase small subunit